MLLIGSKGTFCSEGTLSPQETLLSSFQGFSPLQVLHLPTPNCHGNQSPGEQSQADGIPISEGPTAWFPLLTPRSLGLRGALAKLLENRLERHLGPPALGSWGPWAQPLPCRLSPLT